MDEIDFKINLAYFNLKSFLLGIDYWFFLLSDKWYLDVTYFKSIEKRRSQTKSPRCMFQIQGGGGASQTV